MIQFVRLKSVAAKFLWRVCPNLMAKLLVEQMRKGKHIMIHGEYDFFPHIKENCEFFLNKEQLADNRFLEKIIYDIVKSYYLYATNANEYFCYKFQEKQRSERMSYLPKRKKDIMLTRQMAEYVYYFNQIKDKNAFYEIAKPFFGREACRIEKMEDLNSFVYFATKHPRFIAKPTRGGCGKGIEILDLGQFAGKAEEAFSYLRKDNETYIVEELVDQDSRMAEWNSSSLNTIRVPSMRTKSGIVVFYPSIRIGRAGSIVDNAGAGGTFAAIDPKTGEVISDGFDKRGHSYKQHPDSHKPFKGSEIPEWEALLSFSKRLHESMPIQHKYLAFDLALSTKGWVVVEANWGELSMPQVEFGKGLYNEFKTLLES